MAITDDVSIKADSLAVMEDAIRVLLPSGAEHGNGDADPKAIRDNLREAVTIAKEVAPYRHPRLSSVKVGTDRANAPSVPDGVTAAEVQEELFSMIARSGILPTAMAKRLQRAESLLEHHRVVNRGNNSEGNNQIGSPHKVPALEGPSGRIPDLPHSFKRACGKAHKVVIPIKQASVTAALIVLLIIVTPPSREPRQPNDGVSNVPTWHAIGDIWASNRQRDWPMLGSTKQKG